MTQRTVMRWVAILVPICVMMLIGLLSSLPGPLMHLGVLLLPCDMLLAWYIRLHHPEWLPMKALLLLGVWYDMLRGTLFGVHGLLYVVIAGWAQWQARRLHDEGFLIQWMVSMMVLFVITLAIHGMLEQPWHWIVDPEGSPPWGAWARSGIGYLCIGAAWYPAVHLSGQWFARWLERPRWYYAS